ncbi:unnamed protein product [Choristocarpus tenellus]
MCRCCTSLVCIKTTQMRNPLRALCNCQNERLQQIVAQAAPQIRSPNIPINTNSPPLSPLPHFKFRAVFAFNVVVKNIYVPSYAETTCGMGRDTGGVNPPGIPQPQAIAIGGSGDVGVAEEEEETNFPVYCGDCGNEVGVFDTEEVYHFFNVIASG